MKRKQPSPWVEACSLHREIKRLADVTRTALCDIGEEHPTDWATARAASREMRELAARLYVLAVECGGADLAESIKLDIPEPESQCRAENPAPDVQRSWHDNNYEVTC